MLCVECEFIIDEKTGKCQKCGRVAFKVDEDSTSSNFVEPYLPGGEDITNTGRVPMIKVEPLEKKLPLMAIISNVVLILGVICILIFYLTRR